MKDPYIQENGTLKNKLGITKYKDLNDAEKDIGFAKLIDIGESFKQKYDVEYIKSIHRHIFEDIFDWAGEFRTVPVYKTEIVIPGLSLEYSAPKNIEKDLNSILEELNKVATSYGIMKKGKLIECVTNEELNQRCRQYLQIKVDSSSKASMLLEQMLSIYSYAVIDKNTIHIFDEVSSDKIIKMLVMNDVAVYSCMLNSQSLEEYFLSRNGGIE